MTTTFEPVTAAEYALIRKHLPASKVGLFDELRESGARLSEVADDKSAALTAWKRAVKAARGGGLARYVRVHDLRLTKARNSYAAA